MVRDDTAFGQTLLHRSLIKVWFISSCITGAAVMRHECLHIWIVLLATVWQKSLSLWSVIADDNMFIWKTSVLAGDLWCKRQIYNCFLLLLQNAPSGKAAHFLIFFISVSIYLINRITYIFIRFVRQRFRFYIWKRVERRQLSQMWTVLNILWCNV